MKNITKKGFMQKSLIILMLVLCITFITPTYSSADLGGVLFDPICDFLCSIGDGIINVLQKCMTGDWGAGFSVDGGFLIPSTDTSKFPAPSGGDTVHVKTNDFYYGWLGLSNTYYVPTARYSPEEIFAGNVKELDINFINPNFNDASNPGSAARLQANIAKWYVALRRLAVVGLLSVLVYVGIRILLASTAADKAKFKQLLTDWLVALVILYFLHYIMAFTLTMTQAITTAITGVEPGSASTNDSITVTTDDGNTFGTNLLGLARFQTQYKDFGDKVAYMIMYLALVIYTLIFTWFYLRRMLMMAFLTLIAPLVALTYPIDKMNDGKAQAFDSWLKEYVYNALIQPFHLIIYMVFVGTAMDIARDNIIYMIAALGFILPAEKILRNFFGFNKAGATLGSVLGGAAVGSMLGKGLGALAGGRGKPVGGGQGGGPNLGAGAEANKPLRFAGKHDIGDVMGPGEGGQLGAALGAASAERESREEEDNGPFPDAAMAEYYRNSFREQEEENLSLEDRMRRMEENDYNYAYDPEYQALAAQKALEEQARAAQDTAEAQEEAIRNNRFLNWTRAHDIRPGSVARAVGRTGVRAISGAARLGTNVAFRGGAGALAGAVALASGAGGTGAMAAFMGGAALGGVPANAVIKRGAAIRSGTWRAAKGTAGFLGASAVGIGTGISQGSASAGMQAMSGSRAMRFAKDAVLNGSALGREIDLANGNTAHQDAGKLAAFKNNRENMRYVQEQMAAQGWTDSSGHKHAAGSMPSMKAVKDRMNTFDTYVGEGMSDIKEIMSAQKAEQFIAGDDATRSKQAALIASIGKERGLTKDTLNDSKKYQAEFDNLKHDYMSKGFGEANAEKQTKYVMEMLKAQNGLAHNLQAVERVDVSSVGKSQQAQPTPQPTSQPTSQPTPQPLNSGTTGGNTGTNPGGTTRGPGGGKAKRHPRNNRS